MSKHRRALEYAIQPELEREKYYGKLMEFNKNNSLYAVCLMLAEDKKRYARILSKRLQGLPYMLIYTDLLEESNNIFNVIQ